MVLSKKINYFLCVLPILLFSIGYITHLSTSTQRATSHLVFFVISYGLFIFSSLFDYRLYLTVYKHLYKFVLGSLVVVFILGETILGSVRWISFGIFNFQPSEFAKFGLLIFMAFYIYAKPKTLGNPKELVKLLLIVFPIIGMVLIQPDLGSSLVLIAIVGGVLFSAGLHWIYFISAFGLFGLFSTPIWHLLKDYQKHRILVFLNPSLDTLGRGYNVIQSLVAIGSSGIYGKGFGRGSQSHLNFLPIYWTDFVFAAFVEEWGFIGSVILILLFIALLAVIIHVSIKSSDQLGSMLSLGVFSALFVQFSINIGMNLGLLPVTGIPLPLVSYGGTSMFTTMLLLGLVHSVWIHRSSDEI